ncbi:phosphate ABC transporter substrate-binding protein PstS [Roseomonas gilardii]|uniref:Phosphate-binding protein PstS n=1 Tax=Roseomonas gilardii TaxID=257708 RepID=A0A1L7AHC2_9PROT|nr:phosphate ABC transporter substrate-binding protein PstS [Roseomonas gilardii]APT58099.1 phosphate ABC transporter substrate-binding protein PstS [Roseomonas gilardii]MDT8330128.1 phosphate ABC transporter substrate-binding protein PstS [Roseomonas gilardii]PZR15189.1 MAG: phosphate ABC transporter substrate-binding protein PstS [Azospirillum brasilense]
MYRRSLALLTGLALLTAAVPHGALAQTAEITGAGASFPNPVYQRWGEGAKAIGIQLNYQSVGSGAGINQIRNRTVDFGASDAPLKPEQLTEAKLVQFPAVMGSVVPIVNLPGVEIDQLKLTGEILADIYAGKITKWNDPKLVELNQGVTLPNVAIAPVYRADASGTSFVFTSYLSAVSSDWQGKVGAATSVKWPAGAGARGNEGVAGTVRNTRGAIGYVENAYATQNKLTTVQLRNKAGKFVKPTMESFIAAAGNADWSAPGMAASIIDQQGDASWPIVSPTFILLPANPENADRSRAVMRFFDWAFTHGGDAARQLEYIPLPENVQAKVRDAWKQVNVDGKPVWNR